MPNIVPIGQTVAEIWPFLDFFQDGGRRYLEFLKFVTVRMFTKFKLRFGFFKMAAAVILDF